MTTDVGSFKSYQLNEGRTTPVYPSGGTLDDWPCSALPSPRAATSRNRPPSGAARGNTTVQSLRRGCAHLTELSEELGVQQAAPITSARRGRQRGPRIGSGQHRVTCVSLPPTRWTAFDVNPGGFHVYASSIHCGVDCSRSYRAASKPCWPTGTALPTDLGLQRCLGLRFACYG